MDIIPKMGTLKVSLDAYCTITMERRGKRGQKPAPEEQEKNICTVEDESGTAF
jgi:hypothetical protein